MSKTFKVKFINHACIQIFHDEYSVLIDPWFDGKVFNNSWKLLQDTDIANVELENLKYIVFSHEHPDHLNFDTLKKIYAVNNNVTCIFPNRKDDTVKKVIEKIGYKFSFLKQNSEKFYLNEKDYFKFFSKKPEGDHTIVLSVDNKVIVNQNDDYTDDDTIKLILDEFNSVDILLTQFSLAGYYGNSNDKELIKTKGHDFHLNRVKHYQEKFNSRIVVPFASYIYFCKKTNAYLNEFKVTPKEIYNLLGTNICQLVSYDDQIFFNKDFFIERNITNLERLENLFNSKNLVFDETENIEIEKIKEMINRKLKDMDYKKKFRALTNNFNFLDIVKGIYKFFLFQKPLTIKINDLDEYIKIDFLKNSCAVISKEKNIYDFSIPSEELLYMFKFPWGSDTANITGTVNYYSKRSFYFFEYLQKYYHLYGTKFY